MKRGWYVEIINAVMKETKTVNAVTKEDAVDICRDQLRAEAHEWAQFPGGLGNYDIVIFEKWGDGERAYL